MKSSFIKFIPIVVVIFFIIIFSSCQKNDDEITTISFWAMGVEGENVSKLIPEFEKKYPDIKVKVQQVPWTAAHEKLITAFASGTLPDVFQLGNTWIPEFAALNSLEPLNNYIKNSNIIKPENYFKGIWATNEIDSIIYGIPWYVDTRILFYRKDILQKAGYNEPPKTWNELYDVSKKIKALYPKEKKYAIFIPTNEWAHFVIFGLQANSNLLKMNNQYGDFSGKEFKQAFTFLSKFYDEGLAPIGMTEVSNIYQAFTEGFFAMYITGPWNVTEMKNRLPENMQDKWMTAPLPAFQPKADQPKVENQNDYPGVSLAGGASFVINNKSKNKSEAWKWIEFLSEKNTQIKFYKLVSSLPAVKAAWEDSSIVNNIYLKAFYEQLQKVVPTPKVPEWEQIVFGKIQQYAEMVAAKKTSIDKALSELDKDVNQILEKRRWMLSKQ